MAKEETSLEVQGKVVAALANTQFRVRLDNGHEIIAHISGEVLRTSSASCPAIQSPSRFRRTT